jgi:hypothetical protein
VADGAEPRSTPGAAASGTPLVDVRPEGPEIVDAPDDPVVGLLLTATELGVALVGMRRRCPPQLPDIVVPGQGEQADGARQTTDKC